jgi:hypothetical protein
MMDVVIYDDTSSVAIEDKLNDSQANLVVLLLTMISNNLLDSSKVSNENLKTAYDLLGNLTAQEIDIQLEALITLKLFEVNSEFLSPVYVYKAEETQKYGGFDFLDYSLLEEEVPSLVIPEIKTVLSKAKSSDDDSLSDSRSQASSDDEEESVKSKEFEISPALSASSGSLFSPTMSPLSEPVKAELPLPLRSARYGLRELKERKNYSEFAGENDEFDSEDESKREKKVKLPKIKKEPGVDVELDKKKRTRMYSVTFRQRKKQEMESKDDQIDALRRENQMLHVELSRSQQIVSNLGRYAMFSPAFPPVPAHTETGSTDIIPQSINNALLSYLPPGPLQTLDDGAKFELNTGYQRRK